MKNIRYIPAKTIEYRKLRIILNFDVLHTELPPLVQDYKYLDFKEDNAIDSLINVLKKKLNNT